MVAVLVGGGCKHTLEPGGPYSSPVVYDVELTIVTSWDILDAVMEWEDDNRLALSKYPEVGRALDAIRARAPGEHLRAIRLAEVYEATLSQEDKTAAEKATAILRSTATEALSFMTEYGIGQ